MKAVFIVEQGGVETLLYEEYPEPEGLGADEVLVRVRACSVNRRDLFTREGSHGMRPELPAVLGQDFAGEVAAAGELAARRFAVGERVMGIGLGGTYAEYTRARMEQTVGVPEGITYEQAAAVPVVFATAWHMLVCKAKVAAGEDVLVMAGGSGLGSAAIQIARLYGARVITTASSAAKLEQAKALGAEVGINYREGDWAGRVREVTGGAGVDVVVEHIGASVWEQCYGSLKRGGRLVTCGVTSGHLVELHLGRLWTRDLTLMGTGIQAEEDLGVVAKLVGRGQLRPVVQAVYPLEEAARAHQELEESNFFGKIVLSVP